MTPKRIVFFGTPEFAVPILRSLYRETELVLVVTQPDRPSGRGRKMSPPPAKKAASELGIEVFQPNIVKGRRFSDRIAGYSPDFIVTAAFGRVLGPSLLDVPNADCLNVHASILPKYRGAAPANWAVLNGDQESGISIMRMEKGLDTGPVFSITKTPVGSEETAGELLARLSEIGAATIAEAIRRFDELEAIPQDHEHATWARMLKKNDGVLDWTRSASDLHCHVRGMHPWPTANTRLRGEPIKAHAARVVSQSGKEGAPGLVLEVSDEGIDVACGEGVLRLVEVQAAGRKRLPVRLFLTGTRVESGFQLGE
ncbi:MAG: methionyl-tRNA formyltransferase [Deltaproteobacteria bacterium]|nr:methionyl-tRNA formyltransferase [Deltaproteobacteria bacterium]